MTDSTTNHAHLAVSGLTARPGERVSGLVEVDLGAAVVSIPVVLINGVRAGRRVGITAGIHGAEYVSIAALRGVVMELDPAAVDGSIAAVLTANPAAFAAVLPTLILNPNGVATAPARLSAAICAAALFLWFQPDTREWFGA